MSRIYVVGGVLFTLLGFIRVCLGDYDGALITIIFAYQLWITDDLLEIKEALK